MNSKAILVVDDDPAAARYMILALQEAFQPVTLASDAIQALLAMERDVPALVVSDLRMPDLDGLELLTLIKERWPEVPVILVTVEQDIATVVEAVKRGAANYLVKPVSPASLCTAAEKALATTTCWPDWRSVPWNSELRLPPLSSLKPRSVPSGL